MLFKCDSFPLSVRLMIFRGRPAWPAQSWDQPLEVVNLAPVVDRYQAEEVLIRRGRRAGEQGPWRAGVVGVEDIRRLGQAVVEEAVVAVGLRQIRRSCSGTDRTVLREFAPKPRVVARAAVSLERREHTAIAPALDPGATGAPVAAFRGAVYPAI